MCPLIKNLAVDCLEMNCNYFNAVKGCMYERLQQQRADEEKKHQERNRELHMAIDKA